MECDFPFGEPEPAASKGGDRLQGLFRRRFHIVIPLAISPEAGIQVFCFSVPVVLTNFKSIQTPWHQGSVL